MPCVCKVCGWSKDAPEDYTSWPRTMVKTDIYPITDSGTRNGNVIGFICAKCLASATRMRLHVKAMLSQVMVAHKALMSFLARQASAMIDRVISYASPNAIYGETRRSDGPDVDRT